MASIRGLRRAKRIGHVPRDVGIRIISTLGFSRSWRICLAPSGRRTCGVGRLPRAALRGCAASLCPGLTCFAPSGQGDVFTHGRFLRGWWFFGPRRRDPTVLTLRRGNNRISLGRAERRKPPGTVFWRRSNYNFLKETTDNTNSTNGLRILSKAIRAICEIRGFYVRMCLIQTCADGGDRQDSIFGHVPVKNRFPAWFYRTPVQYAGCAVLPVQVGE